MGVDINQYRMTIGTFSRNGPYKFKEKYEKPCKEKENIFMILLKCFLLLSVSFVICSTELNNLKHGQTEPSICKPEQHKLSSLSLTVGGRLVEGRSINYCRTFFKKEDKGTHFYSFSNLDNKFSKFTHCNKDMLF